MTTEQTTLDEQERPPGVCFNWPACTTETPFGTASENQLCDACLDAVRANGRGHDL